MSGSVVKMVLPQQARIFLVEHVFSCGDECTEVCANAPRISRDASQRGERKIGLTSSEKLDQLLTRRQVLTQNKELVVCDRINCKLYNVHSQTVTATARYHTHQQNAYKPPALVSAQGNCIATGGSDKCSECMLHCR
jgi:hypothetical protein